jgi:hypothetical protein
MLLFHNAGPDTHRHLTPEQKTKLMEQWNDWYDGLMAQGKVEQGRPLELAGRVISMSGGRVMDGPYAETKEAIGGFFMLKVADMDEAVAIGKQCPSLPLGLTVEVRPLADCSPVLDGLRARTAATV